MILSVSYLTQSSRSLLILGAKGVKGFGWVALEMEENGTVVFSFLFPGDWKKKIGQRDCKLWVMFTHYVTRDILYIVSRAQRGLSSRLPLKLVKSKPLLSRSLFSHAWLSLLSFFFFKKLYINKFGGAVNQLLPESSNIVNNSDCHFSTEKTHFKKKKVKVFTVSIQSDQIVLLILAECNRVYILRKIMFGILKKYANPPVGNHAVSHVSCPMAIMAKACCLRPNLPSSTKSGKAR